MYLENLLVGLLIGIVITGAVMTILISRIEKRHLRILKQAREDAIKRSKTVIRASISEDIIPLFPDFPYALSDLKLFGQPIDYIVFDGMSEFRDGNKEKELTIILADLKTGKAVKTPVQKAIMSAIERGRIKFEEWRIDENNRLKIR